MKNTKTEKVANKVGRPLSIVRFPRGAFTIKEACTLNQHVCKKEGSRYIIIRKHILLAVSSGKLCRLPQPAKPEGKGAPSDRYMSSAAYAASKANLAKRNDAKTASLLAETAQAVTA
jgi:hypothetical protein